jgi:HK97 family phage major capsid protein
MSEEVVSNELAEKRERFFAKQADLAEVMKLASDGDKVNLSRSTVLKKLGATDSPSAAEKIKEWDSELQALGSELRNAEMKAVRDRNRQREELRGEPADGEFRHPSEMVRKSFGEMFVSTKSFVESVRSRTFASNATIDMSIKTLFETTAGFAPESIRTGQIVPAAVRPPQLLDFIPVRPTQYELVKYMEETTATFNAAEKAEGTAYAESVFEYTEQESPVRKITISLPVTDEQLQDAPEVAAILDTRLRFGIMQRLDQQVFNGDGSAPNLAGILDYTSGGHSNGDIQTLAQNGGGVGDSIFDAVFSAMMAVRTTGRANPNVIVLHPTDWAIVRLTRTDLGEYVMGPPSQVGANTLFGLPVALVEAGSAGTGIVGDFANFAYIAERRGIDVQAGYSGTQFVEGKKTLRADLRAAFVVLRPAAFCSMTALAAPGA